MGRTKGRNLRLAGWPAILRDIKKLEEHADKNLMKFNKYKCTVLCQTSSIQQHQLQTNWLGGPRRSM